MHSASGRSVVWFEIPVADMAGSQAFYDALLQDDVEQDDACPVPAAVDDRSDTPRVLRRRPPQSVGPKIHLAATLPLATTLLRIGRNGGQVISEVVSMPAGRFASCLDPDGNSFGLFAR